MILSEDSPVSNNSWDTSGHVVIIFIYKVVDDMNMQGIV